MKPYYEILEYSRLANINEDKVDPKKIDKFVEEIKKTKLQVTIKVTDSNSLYIECGRDYPDEFADKVDAVLKKAGISFNAVNVCADTSGKFKDTIRVNGGAKRRW